MAQYINDKGLQLIKHYESLHDDNLKTIDCEPKMDCDGKWTSGYGRLLIDPVTKRILEGSKDKARAYQIGTVTPGQALLNLAEDTRWVADEITKRLKVVLTDNQFSALISFCYNGGIGFLYGQTSTVGKKINASNFEAAMTTLLQYDKSKGTRKPGLVARRMTERTLFLTGKLVFYTVNKTFKVTAENEVA